MNQRPIHAKVIKEALYEIEERFDPVVKVSGFYFSNFNIYISIELIMIGDHFNDAHPADYVSLHLSKSESNFFYFFNAEPIAMPAKGNCIYARKMLVMMSAADFMEGDYGISLYIDGQYYDGGQFKISETGILPSNPIEWDRPSPRPFIISGTQKSGTTWLEAVVNASPSNIVLHEANLLNVVDGVGLTAGLENSYDHFEQHDFVSWRPAHPNLREYVDFMQVCVARTLMERLGNMWGGEIVADRTPHYGDRYISALRFWPEVKILHIARNPLDVLVSWVFHELNHFVGGEGKAGGALLPKSLLERLRLQRGDYRKKGELFATDAEFYQGYFDSLLDAWLKDQAYAQRAKDLFPDRIMILRYEDLKADLKLSAQNIYRFIGNEVSEEQLVEISDATDFKTMSKGRLPGQEDRESFFRKGQSNDYVNFLSEKQITYCWNKVSGVATQFGYTIPKADWI